MQPVDELGGERGGPVGAYARFAEGNLPPGAGELAPLHSGSVAVDELLSLLDLRADGVVLERECGQDEDGGLRLRHTRKELRGKGIECRNRT